MAMGNSLLQALSMLFSNRMANNSGDNMGRWPQNYASPYNPMPGQNAMQASPGSMGSMPGSMNNAPNTRLGQAQLLGPTLWDPNYQGDPNAPQGNPLVGKNWNDAANWTGMPSQNGKFNIYGTPQVTPIWR